MRKPSLPAALFALAAICDTSAAQSVNIDFGPDNNLVPDASYGAAANQPGFWNRGGGISSPLRGLDGVTSVGTMSSNAFDDGYRDIPGATDGDEALMETVFLAYANGAKMWFDDLDPGQYELYLYGWGSNWQSTGGGGVADFYVLIEGSGTGVYRLDFKSTVWPGGQVENETYLKVPITLAQQSDGGTYFSIDMRGVGDGFHIIQGLQLVRIPAPAAPAVAILSTPWAFRRRR